ncbi:MAG: hypothetical protein ABH857_03430 [Elusimicrobiota bacterium]
MSEQKVNANDGAIFFPVSKMKLAVMSLCTLGIYDIYWFYKYWVYIKKKTGENIMPITRAVIAIIFCYQCFAHVSNEVEKHNIKLSKSALYLTIWYVLFLIFGLAPVLVIIGMLKFIPLLYIQEAVNKANAKSAPDMDPNSRITWKNILAMIPGAILLLINIIGLFVRA